MTPHNGIIEIHTIENTGNNADEMGLLTAQFVFYADCQQLKVWLPKTDFPKWDYGSYRIINRSTHTIVEVGQVETKVSGNTQMLFDTHGFPEGEYLLEIESPKGGLHCLYFQKHVEGFIPENLKPAEPPSTDDTMREMFW